MSFWRMQWRRTWIAALAYVASFALGILNALAFGIDLSAATELPTSVWLVALVIQAVITALFALWYFASKHVEPSWRSGLWLGITFVIVGFVFDFAFVIPSIVLTDAPSDIGAYYSQPLFWVSLVETILIAIGWGALTASRRSPKMANRMRTA